MQVAYSHDFCIVHAENDVLKQWEDDLVALNGYYRPQTNTGRAGYYFLAQQSAQIADFVKDANAGTIQPKQIAQSTPVSRPHIKRRVNYLDYEVQVKDETQTPEIKATLPKPQGVRVITITHERPVNYIPAPKIKSMNTHAQPQVRLATHAKVNQPVRTITHTHARPASVKTTSTTSVTEPLNPPALREFINSKSDVIELLNAYGDHPRVKELLQRLAALSM